MKLLYKPCQKQQRTKKKLTPKQIINYQKKLLDLMKKRKNLLIKTNRDRLEVAEDSTKQPQRRKEKTYKNTIQRSSKKK